MFPPPPHRYLNVQFRTLPHLHGNGASLQPSTRGYDKSSGSEPFPPVERALLSAGVFHFTLSQCHSSSFAPFPVRPLHSVRSRFEPYLAIHRRRIRRSSGPVCHAVTCCSVAGASPSDASTMGHGGPLVPVSSRGGRHPLWAVGSRLRFPPLDSPDSTNEKIRWW